MGHLFGKASKILTVGAAAFFVLATHSNAMEEEYQKPVLSGAAQTWIYQGESFDISRNRVFADDQEDGDLTAKITKTGDVDTSKPGSYTITYKVTDADGRSSDLQTVVKVLSRNGGSTEDKKIQRILYTLPDASHLTDIGFNRGYYHDRQSLGFWIPAGNSLKIRLVNGQQFQQDLELRFMNNDQDMETVIVNENQANPVSAVSIPSNGEWVTVKNSFVRDDGTKGSVDSVPFITTPKDTTVQPIVEIEWNDNFRDIPYYRYGDDQERFFSVWDATQAPYAIVEGDAATFLIPVVDRHNIVRKPGVQEPYQFQSLDDMLEWYAAFVKQYDAYAGLDFHATEPYNQNVRAKFFIKVNNSGVGEAYYTTDHSANNGQYSNGSLGGYLMKNWVSLHEFGHGYEGNIAQQEHPFVETTNNIMGYYFEPTYRPDTDFGWMLGSFSNLATKEARYAALGQKAQSRREETISFSGIVKGLQHFDVSLFMFTNALDKLGPQETVAAMHTQYRKYYYENGKSASSSDIITESFSRTGGYNLLPYFEGWHIHPSEKKEDEIYDLDLPMVYYLKNLIPDDTECEAVRARLGLDGIYSLVSTDDLADTGYTSQVNIQIDIDDLSQIQNKNIRIKNGEKIVREIPVTSENLLVELPVGIYEVELPTANTSGYLCGKEYLAASKGSVSKEFRYSKTDNILAGDIKIQMLGISDKEFATISVDMERNVLIWQVQEVQPHYLFTDTYASIRVLSPSGTQLYQQSLSGSGTPEELKREIAFPVGSRIELYHREASGRLRTVSAYTEKILSEYALSGSSTNVTYVMTEKGLMRADWDESKQKNVYRNALASFSEYLLQDMTQKDLNDPQKFQKQKTAIMQAYELLDEEEQEEYLEKYGVLIGREPESYTEYVKLDVSKLTGFAESEQGGNESAASAVDGDESTFWHSNYENGAKPNLAEGVNNSYTILLDENTDIGKLEYVPRNGGGNGVILSFTLSYSEKETGEDFQEIKVRSHRWEENDSTKSVEFYAPNARRIRMKVLATAGTPADTYISAAEFRLYERISFSAANTYLSGLYLETVKGEVWKDRNAGGQNLSLRVNGQEKTFEKGISLTAGSVAAIDLTGKSFDVFHTWAGVDASQTAEGEAALEIYGDGKLIYRSGTFTGELAEAVYLDISGINRLEIKAVAVSGNPEVSLGNASLKSSRDLTEITLKEGESAAILSNTLLIPQNRGKILWESENTAIAAVDADGIVKAVGEGTTVIRGIGESGGISCTVHVEKVKKNHTIEEKPNPVKKDPVNSEPQKTVQKNLPKPKKVKVKSVKPGKRQAVVSWKKAAYADGYEIWMRMGKKAFKKVKKTSAKRTSVKIKKLKKGKKYTFKVRAYRKDVSKKEIYGAFSKTKTIKIKK